MFNFGITGCGRITERIYLEAIRKIDGAKIVAAADPLIERQNIVSTKVPDCQLFNSLTDMLNNCQIDGLIIASPAKYHITDMLNAIQNNVPVLVEKPLALNSKQLHKINGLTEKEKQLVMIGFNRRFWDPVINLKNKVTTDKISGKYRIITNYLSWDPISEQLDPLDDLMHHQIDITRFISKKEIKKIEILEKDKNIVNIILEDGSLFKLISDHSNMYNEDLMVKINDKEHLIKSSSDRVLPSYGKIRSFYDTIEKYSRLLKKQKSSFNLSYTRELMNFMINSRTKQIMSPGIEDGIIPVKIVEAIRKSSYNGEEINIQ